MVWCREPETRVQPPRTRRHPAPRWLLVLVAAPMLGGCPDVVFRSGETGRDPVTHRLWVLRGLQGTAVPRHDPEAATFQFTPDHHVAGSVNCNSIGSHAHSWYVDVPGRQGHFAHDSAQPTIATTAGCYPTKVTAFGDRFWNLIDTARSWSIASRTLTIRFADGTVARLADAGAIPKRPGCGASTDPNDPASRNLDCGR